MTKMTTLEISNEILTLKNTLFYVAEGTKKHLKLSERLKFLVAQMARISFGLKTLC